MLFIGLILIIVLCLLWGALMFILTRGHPLGLVAAIVGGMGIGWGVGALFTSQGWM